MEKIDFIERELQSLKQRDRYRSIRWIEEGPSPWVRVDGNKVLLLCSNNYLGLANDPRLKKRMLQGIEAWGCGSGGSRSISGSLAIHRLLEERLATFHGSESALLFNSGYSANLSLLSALMGDGDVIYSDELNHASIVDGCRLSKALIRIYRHLDVEHLETLLKENQGKRRKLIVTDGIFSMDGDIAPLPELVELARRYGALTMVDDAHAIGVFGPTGRGTLEQFRVSNEVDILVGTFGKALGCFGAYVAGRRSLIELLINTGRVFLYTTALPPSVSATVLASLDLLDEEPERRERLWTNVHYLRDGLNQFGFDTMRSEAHIIPILTGEPKITMEMDRKLLQRRVLVQGIRPPTVPEGKCRLRVTMMATHTREDLDFALEQFEKVGKEVGLIG
ncbi:MAG: 8-amino-7-oxononanoate synthase [Thermodesulfobacteriota bacterium]